MKIEQFTEWTFAHNPKYNSQNNLLVFQASKPNLTNNTYETNLWSYDISSKEEKKITNSDQDSNVIFLENGNILFSSGRKKNNKDKTKDRKEENKTTFWEINPKGGEAEFAFDVELNVIEIKSLGQGKYLLHGFCRDDKKKEWVEINNLPFWSNQEKYTTDIQYGLYLFDAKLAEKTLQEKKDLEFTKTLKDTMSDESKKESHSDEDKNHKKLKENHKSQLDLGILKLISDEKENVSSFELSPDKKQMIIVSSPIKKVLRLKENLSLMNMETLMRKQVSQEKFQFSALRFANQSQAYIVASDCQTHGLNQDPYVYLLDTEDSTLNKISSETFDLSFGNSVGTDAKFGGGEQIICHNNELYFIATCRDKALLKKINKKGQVKTVIEEAGAINSFAITNDAIYFIAMLDLKLPELYVFDKGKTKQLSSFSQVLGQTKLSEIERFQFESNGDLLDGFVIKPIDYQEDKSYPALLEIHGGPKTVFGTILHHEMQYLASQGYFVFYTNPHGSDGHGIEFSDIRGKYGSIDYQDLMLFTDLVLEKYPQIDCQRLGCLGGSYGGFMVNWIIGHTDRFAAANSQRSISNWLSFYGVSDIGFFFTEDQTASDPWNNPEKAWEHSPLKYANKVTTPTLFIHADYDLRCPLEQGIQMYAALMKHKVDSKLTIFKDENHELSRSGKPQARVKRLSEISKWFAKYLQA